MESRCGGSSTGGDIVVLTIDSNPHHRHLVGDCSHYTASIAACRWAIASLDMSSLSELRPRRLDSDDGYAAADSGSFVLQTPTLKNQGQTVTVLPEASVYRLRLKQFSCQRYPFQRRKRAIVTAVHVKINIFLFARCTTVVNWNGDKLWRRDPARAKIDRIRSVSYSWPGVSAVINFPWA